MAIIQKNLYVLLPVLGSFCLFLFQHSCNAQSLVSCKFNSIYQFGDSISDTGNMALKAPHGSCTQPPYGKSLPSKKTGRCSDGLLLTDYIAQAAGLSFLEPYLNKHISHSSGVSFAFAGASAIHTYPMSDENHTMVPAMNEQLDYFTTYFNKTSSSQDQLKMSLFIVGQIGLNDYNHAISHERKSFEEVNKMVPNVVDAIKNATKRVIDYGAMKVLVPGQWPMGCLPIYLTRSPTNETAAYDQFHCLKKWNNVSESHNYHLKNTIEGLKKEYPNVIIVYGDYYSAFQWLLTHKKHLRFEAIDKLCCGTKGKVDTECGKSPDVQPCANPDKLISWDGIHMTQAAHKYIAEKLIRDILPNLDCGQT